jgi:hypothetical protein
MLGHFLANQGLEILTVNRDSNTVTVISNFTTPTPVFNTFATRGIEPVEAIAVTSPGQALESLIVANNEDGVFTLLGGPGGLEEEAPPLADPKLPAPTALELASITGNAVSFYATTTGVEAAFTLSFILPGFTPATGPAPGSSSATAQALAQLVPLSEMSLPLVGSLLVTKLTNPTNPAETAANVSSSVAPALALAGGSEIENAAQAGSSFLSIAPSQGQGFFTELNTGESTASEDVEEGAESGAGPAPPVNPAQAPPVPAWVRSFLDVDEAIEQIRRENQDVRFGGDEPRPDAAGAPAPDEPEPPPGLPSGDAAADRQRPTTGMIRLARLFTDIDRSAERPGRLGTRVARASAVALAALLVIRANPVDPQRKRAGIGVLRDGWRLRPVRKS